MEKRDMFIVDLGEKLKGYVNILGNKMVAAKTALETKVQGTVLDKDNIKDRYEELKEKVKELEPLMPKFEISHRDQFSLIHHAIIAELRKEFVIYVDGRTDAQNIKFKEYTAAWEIIHASIDLNMVNEWNKYVKKKMEDKSSFGFKTGNLYELSNKKELSAKTKESNFLVSGWLSYNKARTLNSYISKYIRERIVSN